MATTTSEPAEPSAYPAAWEADAVLSDGATVHVRPIRPEDGLALAALHARLSPETVYLRFFSPLPRLSPEMVRRFTHLDYDRRMALVAELGDDMVAVARYDARPATDEAEVAFVVADEHQGRGLGTLLLELLAAYARERGITRFVAETLPGNHRMLGVFHSAGFADARRYDDGVIQVEFAIEPTPASEAAVAARERSAAAASVRRLLAPRSVAVVGASREPGTIGHEVLRRLLAGGFAGPVYPVHPTAPWVASVRAYPSVVDVPDEVDLAVVAVPAAAVPRVVEDCAEKGVDGLVVISAGFAETGPEGAALERRVVERARRNGMRVVGPNCMGVVNTAPEVSLNATFAAMDPLAGRLGISSQSGALGRAILAEAAGRGLGASSFVSVGNNADVSASDLLAYWEEDPATDVVVLHLESFGEPRRFARTARQVARTKAVVAVKSGRTPAGSRATRHTTAAAPAPDLAVDALFRQAGVIRVDTLEQLFDVAQALAHQPLPAGRRVAIVGNTGGPSVLAADACEGAGLLVPELGAPARAALRAILADEAVGNPLDLAPAAAPADYERALAAVLSDEGVDAAIATFVPPLGGGEDEVAAAIARAAATAAKPVLANFLARRGVPEPLRGDPRAVPSYAFPESAALALARMAERAEWLARPEGRVPELPGVDPDAGRAAIAAAVGSDAAAGAPPPPGPAEETWLGPEAAAEVLRAYGVPLAPSVRAASAEAAVAAATRLGFPVALKADSAEARAAEAGAVRLRLDTPEEVAAAYADVAGGPGSGAVVVQAMVEGGLHTTVAIVTDPSFGPVVTFGIGTVAGLVGERSARILPLTDVDAAELVRAAQGSELLFGHRGAPLADVAALEELLLRVGRLADDAPEVVEMALPVVVSPAGVVAVDARVRAAAWRPRPEPAALRRLR